MPKPTSDAGSTLYEPSFHIVLHQPEIPPNTGAIGRTCVALQAKLWLVRPLGFRIDERTLRRAGLDYWQYLQWQVADDWEQLQQEAGEGPRMWMFTKTASEDFQQARYQKGDWLVFGSETSGLPPSLLEQPDRNLRIPTFANVRSLNLSSAVAVAGYEAARQIDLFAGV
ncbi:MAG: tRNA (cytidine(34)-2'-O)-methyltransferase [Pirellulaceae bacterium]